MGPGTDTAIPASGSTPSSSGLTRGPLFRKNTLDEMTVGRTEKPMPGKIPQKPAAPPSPREGEGARRADEGAIPPVGRVGPTTPTDPRPIIRAKSGAGSYEDAGDVKRQKRTKGKTGRPGR